VIRQIASILVILSLKVKGMIDHRWRSLAKWLRVVGGIGGVGFFLSFLILVEVYYPSRRPEVSQPGKGYVTALTWTHPVRYGTGLDERRSQWLFNLFFPAFGLIAAGELIKIYGLGDYSGLRRRPNPPWNHRWGP
jgi:hypothetical protein